MSSSYHRGGYGRANDRQNSYNARPRGGGFTNNYRSDRNSNSYNQRPGGSSYTGPHSGGSQFQQKPKLEDDYRTKNIHKHKRLMGSNVISPRTEKELLKQNKLFKNDVKIVPGMLDMNRPNFMDGQNLQNLPPIGNFG